MRITAKFNGTCKSCGCFIPKGTTIFWTRADGANHATTAECIQAKARKAAQPNQVAPAVTTPVNMSAIVAMLTVALEHKKFPRARFLGPHDAELLLHLATSKSAYQGAVQVKNKFGDWLGRIEKDGRPAGPMVNDPVLMARLVAIGADPLAEAKRYSALKIACSFCNAALTDQGSIEAGYGPDCARHHGLTHKAKGTPVLVAPEDATQAA